MLKYIRISVTFIVTTASLVFMVPAACSSPVPPRNISQDEQTAETKDPGESCLWNQFLSPNLTCENCTFCTQGTEHSPKGQCGNGWGVETTCTPCAEDYFQTGEGFTGLVCSRCVTCYPGAKYRQNCTTTQNAECAPCPPGKYEFQPNICFECEHEPSHPDCPQPTTIKPTASSNLSAPTLPSLISLPESTTPVYTTPSSPALNTTIDHGEQGTPTTKFTVYDIVIVAVVPVIVICVVLLAVWGYKKWKAEKNSASESVLPSKSTAKCTFPNAAYGDLPTNDSNDEGSSVGSSQSEIQREIAEESAALVPGAETTAPTSANTPSNEQRQGASNPVDQSSALLPSDHVSNIELSLPGALSSNDGAGDDAWYNPHHDHRSHEDKDTSEFGDEDGSMSRPKSLLSKSLLSD